MTKTDRMIFWGTLALSVLLLFCTRLLFLPAGEQTIVIEQNGKVYASYQKSGLHQAKQLAIQTEQGYHLLEVSSQGAKVLETDCKDRLCVGEIHKPGELLVCLPQRLVIKIQGNGEVDGVAY